MAVKKKNKPEKKWIPKVLFLDEESKKQLGLMFNQKATLDGRIQSVLTGIALGWRINTDKFVFDQDKMAFVELNNGS